MSSSNCASAGLMACGLILMEASVPSHLATTLTAPPPLAGFDGAGGQLGLDLFHLLLHARSLFHEFSNAGHRDYWVGIVGSATSTIWPLKTSRAF